jgi:hypothetical protein
MAGETIQVVVDKAEVLHLAVDASTILTANPEIIDLVVESPQLLLLLGKRPGETNLIILGERGREILVADVVVVPNLERHVTVYRNTEESTLSCALRCASVPTPGQPPPTADGETSASTGATAEAAAGME